MIRFEILLFFWLVDVCGGPVLSEGKDTSQMNQEVTVSPDNPLMLQCPNTPVTGEDGKPVILPCSTKNKTDISNDTIRWLFKDPTDGDYTDVHTYHQRKDQLQKQSDEFKNRTSLFKEELSSGNCSLNLTVTTSHDGTYQCRVVIDGKPHYCQVNLEVLPKGKNNSSKMNQHVTVSPDNTNNGTDGLNNIIGGVVGGVLGVVALIIIITLASCCREQLKNFCSQRNYNNSQKNQDSSLRAQQPPQNQEDQNPQEEQILLNVIVHQGDSANGNVRSRSRPSSKN